MYQRVTSVYQRVTSVYQRVTSVYQHVTSVYQHVTSSPTAGELLLPHDVGRRTPQQLISRVALRPPPTPAMSDSAWFRRVVAQSQPPRKAEDARQTGAVDGCSLLLTAADGGEMRPSGALHACSGSHSPHDLKGRAQQVTEGT